MARVQLTLVAVADLAQEILRMERMSISLELFPDIL